MTLLSHIHPTKMPASWGQVMGRLEREVKPWAFPHSWDYPSLQSVGQAPHSECWRLLPSLLLLPGDCLWPEEWKNREKKSGNKEKWGVWPTLSDGESSLSCPSLRKSWRASSGLSLSALWCPLPGSGCPEFGPRKYQKGRYSKFTTGLAALQILVTLFCLLLFTFQSTDSCFRHSLQVLRCIYWERPGGVCLLHPTWNQNPE